jgi:glycosyltransferase involved in cell wall biosynthesis
MNKTNDIIKVSIIIPVYNSGKYLKHCLDSLINQTLKEIEIICIDDGSTDESPIILKEYVQKDERIKVLEQENSWAATARNRGLEIAHGQYIGFTDSDDWIESRYYETLYKHAQVENADIAVSPAIVASSISQTYQWIYPQKLVYLALKNESLKNEFDFLVVWNSIFRTDFLKDNNIKFDENVYGIEDNEFALKAKYYSKKTIPVLDVSYHYRKRLGGQVSQVPSLKICEGSKISLKNIIAFINSVPLDKNEYLNIFCSHFLQTYNLFCRCLKNIYFDDNEQRNFFDDLALEFKKCAYPSDLKTNLNHPVFDCFEKNDFDAFIHMCKNRNKTQKVEAKYEADFRKFFQIKTDAFYNLQEVQYMSAIRVLTLLKSFSQDISSAIDIDCQAGIWLKAWLEINKNNQRILGLTADLSEQKEIFVPKETIKIVDIKNISFDDIGEHFDMALSLGSVRNLNGLQSCEHIKFLSQLSDMVLFSENTPLNGQKKFDKRNADYWNYLFRQNGFVCFDVFRLKLWDDPWIAWQYRQNIVLYAKGSKIDALKEAGLKPVDAPAIYYYLDVTLSKLYQYRKYYQSLLYLAILFFIVIVLFILILTGII